MAVLRESLLLDGGIIFDLHLIRLWGISRLVIGGFYQVD